MENTLRELLTRQANLLRRRNQGELAQAAGAGGAGPPRAASDLDAALGACRREIRALRKQIQQAATQVKEEFEDAKRQVHEVSARQAAGAADAETARQAAALRERQAALAARFHHLRALWQAQRPGDVPAPPPTAAAAPAPPDEVNGAAQPPPPPPVVGPPAVAEPVAPPADDVPLVPLIPLDEAPAGQPADSPDYAVPLEAIPQRWVTAGRILAIVAASVLFVAMVFPWLAVPAEAMAAKMAGAVAEGLAEAFGQSGGDAPGVPSFSSVPIRAVSLVASLAMTGLLFVPRRDLRGLLWWLVATLAAGGITGLSWHHGLLYRRWGGSGSGLLLGPYVGLLGAVVAFVAGGLAGWYRPAFRKAAWAGPAVVVALGAFLFTHAFGMMAGKLTLSAGEPAVRAAFGTPRARATLFLDNTGWDTLHVIGPGAKTALTKGLYVLRGYQEVDGNWQPCEDAAVLSVPVGDSLLGLLHGRSASRGCPLRPGRSTPIQLNFAPAWKASEEVTKTRAGGWRVELWQAGRAGPLQQVALEIPGVDHPNWVFRKRLAAIRELHDAKRTLDAWQQFRALGRPRSDLSAAGKAEHLKLSNDVWRAAAEHTLAELAELPDDKLVPDALVSLLRDVRRDAAARHNENRDLSEKLDAESRRIRQRLVDADRRKRLVAAAEEAFKSRDIDRMLRALADLQRALPGDEATKRLAARLKTMAPDLADAALAEAALAKDPFTQRAKYQQAWRLINHPGLAVPGGPDAAAWADRAWKCARGLAAAKAGNAARQAMDSAAKLDPALADKADFQADLLFLPGMARPSVADYRRFIDRFPDHPKASTVRKTIVRASVGRALDPKTTVTKGELENLLKTIEEMHRSGGFAADGELTAWVSQAIKLRLELMSPTLAQRPVLDLLDKLYAHLLAKRADAEPPDAAGEPTAADLRALLQETRSRLGWGLSLGDVMDHQEVRMTLQLNPLVIDSPRKGAEAVRTFHEHRLILLKCNRSDISSEAKVDALQKWTMAGGAIWLMNTDVVHDFAYPRTQCDMTKRPTTVRVLLAPDRTGANAPLVEGLPPSLGGWRLPIPCYGFRTEAEGAYVSVLRGQMGRGKACFVALTKFGKGQSVLLSLPVERNRPGMSRLIFNLKRYACNKLPKPAGTQPAK